MTRHPRTSTKTWPPWPRPAPKPTRPVRRPGASQAPPRLNSTAIVAAMASAALDAAAESWPGWRSMRPATASTRTRSSRTGTTPTSCATSMAGMRTKGVLWVDEPGRMTAIGSPVGVIAAIIPVTNPTSTVIFKCLAAVKSGNAVVHAPHPRAARCCLRTAEVMAAAAVRPARPRGDLCLERASIAATGELMRHPDMALVMATGGAGMVRAAYRAASRRWPSGPGTCRSTCTAACPTSTRPPDGRHLEGVRQRHRLRGRAERGARRGRSPSRRWPPSPTGAPRC